MIPMKKAISPSMKPWGTNVKVTVPDPFETRTPINPVSYTHLDVYKRQECDLDRIIDLVRIEGGL